MLVTILAVFVSDTISGGASRSFAFVHSVKDHTIAGIERRT